MIQTQRPSMQPAPSAGQWWAIHIYTDLAELQPVAHLVLPIAARAERWFFIYYAEGGLHLRVRVRHDEQLAMRLAQAAAQTGVAKVLGVAYQRELDRYGGHTCIEAAEAVFHQSSQLALSLLQAGCHRGQYFGYAGTLAVAAFTMADLNIDAALGRYEQGIESVVRGIDERAAAMAPAATMKNAAARWRYWGETFARNPEQAPPHVSSYLHALRNYIAHVRQEAGTHRVEDVVGSQLHMTCNRMALSVVDELCMMRALGRSAQTLEIL